MRNAKPLPLGSAVGGFEITNIRRSDGYYVDYGATRQDSRQGYILREFFPTEVVDRPPNAAKLTPLSDAASQDFQYGLKAFLAETQSLALIDDVRVSCLLDCIQENGTAYQVSSRQSGGTLAERFKAGCNSTRSSVALRRLLMPALSTLKALARHGVVHGDIHPGALFVRENGLLVLQDFGMARLYMAERLGTSVLRAGYASLGHYLGAREISSESDAYGLGACLYWCLVGQPPLNSPERARALMSSNVDLIAPLPEPARERCTKRLLDKIDDLLAIDVEYFCRHQNAFARIRGQNLTGAAAPAIAKSVRVPRDQVITQQIPAVAVPSPQLSRGTSNRWVFYSFTVVAAVLALAAGGLWFAG